MVESVIAGTELTITFRIVDGVMKATWDKMPTEFLFHEGFAAIVSPGKGDTEGMVELQRVHLPTALEAAGHVEPLLS